MSGSDPDVNATSIKTLAAVRALAGDHTHVAICCDLGASFRKQIDATYKGNRPEKQAPLYHQIDLAKDALRLDGFPIWQQDGYEADDIIATAVSLAMEQGLSVTIASSDKDLLQLVDDNCQVRAKSLTTGTIYDEAAVREKFGVLPSQMRDYLALVGDASDNVKGLPGVGAKTAAAILGQHGSILALYEKLQATTDYKALGLTPKLADAFIEGQATVLKSSDLVTLRPDAAIPFADVLAPRVPVKQEFTKMAEAEAALTVEDATQAAQTTAETPKTDVLAVRPPVTVEPFTGAWERQLEPRQASHVLGLAPRLFDSKLFSGYGNPEAIAAVIFAGREVGLGMMASLRGFHNVKGRVCMAADLMRALVLASGKADYFMCKTRDAKSSTWVTKRKTDPEPVTLTFTFEEAQKAGLVSAGSGWEKHPSDMVAKTASSKLARLVYSDVTFGLYAPEELGGETE